MIMHQKLEPSRKEPVSKTETFKIFETNTDDGTFNYKKGKTVQHK